MARQLAGKVAPAGAICPLRQHTGGVDGQIDGIGEILREVGPRLRLLRKARGLSLAELAADTGLSVSLLSRLETGKRHPSLDALIPLAQAFRVPLDQLVGMPETGDPSIHLQPRRLASGGVIVPLTQYQGRLQVFKHVLGPSTPVPSTHEGHAWVYVLSGRLRLILDGNESELNPGEIAEFEASRPHWFGPTGERVEVLHIFGPGGDGPVHSRR